jgi:hypothetical protein
MATLPLNDQQKIWRGLMRYWSKDQTAINILKSDLLSAVQAIDTFLDNNSAAINNAFPIEARTNLSTGQKAIIVALVALARWNPSFLSNIIGGVD